MRRARIICIGKIRAQYWQTAWDHYLGLLRNLRAIEITELRDSADQDIKERKQREGSRILACLKASDLAVAMDEKGRTMTSRQFAEFLRNCDERLCKRPAFMVGGPYGLGQNALSASQVQISLSPMTFPHELARVLLLEQIFRAESILRQTPYHH